VVIMLVALVGYVTVVGHGAVPRVRWALAAGIAMFVVVMAMRLFWYREQTGDFGWFAYAPMSETRKAVLDQLRWRMVGREQVAAVGLLLGVLCLAVAVLALPGRRRTRWAVVTTMIALLLVAVAGVNVWTWAHGAPVLELLAATWPALLATLVAVGITALAGWHGGRAWLLPAGALPVAVAAAVAFDDLAGTWWAWWTLFDIPEGYEDAHMSSAFNVSVDDSLVARPALATTAALGGPALLAIAALHPCRDADPDFQRSD
jgi:hypothetical protein